MNKLLTFPGQMPIYLGDLDFMNQIVRDTFLQLLKGLTGQDNPNCILYGAEATGTEVTAGIVVLNGEIIPSKGVAMNDYMTSFYGFNIESSYSGNRTFKNGVNHNCYETRIAVPIVDPAVVPQFPMKDANLNTLIPNIGNLLVRVMKSYLLAGDFSSTINNMAGNVRILQQGDLFICKGTFKTNDASTGVTELWTATGTFVPGIMGYINEGITLFPIVVESAGSMEMIPAKLVIEKIQNSQRFNAKITIASRDFEAGSILSFSTHINSI